jgi:serine/threonine-protein kinase
VALQHHLGLLIGATMVATLTMVYPTSAQNTALPMTISSAGETYGLVVPNTNTTRSAYGGKLRVYDAHIAKMFEVTHHLCQMDRISGSTTWFYNAGNGTINMGRFQISCRLASEIAASYGLGKMESTTIFFSGEEGQNSSRRTDGIPILNLTGAKVDRWMRFTSNFRPAQ